MSEFNPLALRRLLLLHQFPMFVAAELGTLALLAENVFEQTFRAGMTIATVDTRPSGIHFIISGSVARAGYATLGPRTVLSALEVFARRDIAVTATAVVETHTLKVQPDDLTDLLEDNFWLMQTALRDLAARLAPRVAPGSGSSIGLAPSTGLGLVERLILLRAQPAFAGVRLEALTELANAAEERHWTAGTIAARAGDPATAATIVASGALRSGIHEIGPGQAFGALETLGEVAYASTIVASTDVYALAFSAATIYDVLEDHADFGRAMIATFAQALLATPRVASREAQAHPLHPLRS